MGSELGIVIWKSSKYKLWFSNFWNNFDIAPNVDPGAELCRADELWHYCRRFLGHYRHYDHALSV